VGLDSFGVRAESAFELNDSTRSVTAKNKFPHKLSFSILNLGLRFAKDFGPRRKEGFVQRDGSRTVLRNLSTMEDVA
jgi:hypothetical protein